MSSVRCCSSSRRGWSSRRSRRAPRSPAVARCWTWTATRWTRPCTRWARSGYAELRLAPGEVGFDEGFFVALQHESGVISHVTGNWARQGDVGSRFRVDGAAATLVVPDDDGQTERLMAGRTPKSEGSEWGTVPESRWGAVHRGGVAVRVPSELGDWSAFYTGFARAVRGDGPPPVDPWDAVTNLEVLDAARAGAAEDRIVEVGGTGRAE